MNEGRCGAERRLKCLWDGEIQSDDSGGTSDDFGRDKRSQQKRKARFPRPVCLFSFPFTPNTHCDVPPASQLGDLTSGCASSLAHFNPFNAKHGAPGDIERHVGDLGNIQSDASGTASFNFEDKVISLNGPLGVVGRTLVVHAVRAFFGG